MGSPPQVQTFTRLPGGRLVGRDREREVLGRVLNAARGGDGGVLVVHGEPGVGKTALLEWTVAEGRQFRVLRTVGVEGEMEFPYAALQQLCSPILDRSERLPDPQRDALSVAFGLSAGQAPNPFLVGLAVLGLLSEAARGATAPMCRRRRAVARSCVGARARVRGPPPVGGEDRPRLRGAGTRATRSQDCRSFTSCPWGVVIHEPCWNRSCQLALDEPVLERIVSETRGNPLALLELPRGLTPTQLAGGFGLPAAGALVREHRAELHT